jgi:hypothetical protein
MASAVPFGRFRLAYWWGNAEARFAYLKILHLDKNVFMENLELAFFIV